MTVRNYVADSSCASCVEDPEIDDLAFGAIPRSSSSTVAGFTALWGSAALWGGSTADATESTTIAINGEN